jgi:hypothetical protein
VVLLRDCEGCENIINKNVIAVELKADGIEALGILLDADEQPIDGSRLEMLAVIMA